MYNMVLESVSSTLHVPYLVTAPEKFEILQPHDTKKQLTPYKGYPSPGELEHG